MSGYISIGYLCICVSRYTSLNICVSTSGYIYRWVSVAGYISIKYMCINMSGYTSIYVCISVSRYTSIDMCVSMSGVHIYRYACQCVGVYI